MSTRRPRVIQVITRLIVGGAQLSVLSLCEGLREDYELHIIAGPQTGAEGSLHDRAADVASLTVLDSLRREVSPRWDPVAVRSLRKLLRRLDGDIVHTHSSKAGIVGRFAASPLRARTVHTIHGWGHTPDDSPARRLAFITLERVAARRSDALIAVSADVRTEGLKLRIGSERQYTIIPPAVDLEPLDANFEQSRLRARQELGLDRDAEVVGWVGRFVDQKDPLTLAAALSTLLRSRPGARAVLIGDGPRRDEVRELLDHAGVAARVSCMGVVPEARRLMAGFDVLVHPSLWEGQPVVIQESLAERVPVVAARTSGVEELVKDGVGGYLVKPGSAEEMAAGVRAVLEHATLRAPLPIAVTAKLRASHGADVAVARHRKLYDGLLGRRR